MILTVFLLFGSVRAYTIELRPPSTGLFLLDSDGYSNRSSIFVQDNCPQTADASVVVRVGNKVETTRLYEQIPLYCAVKVHIVNYQVDLDSPYIDVLAVTDQSMSSHVNKEICVKVKLTSATSTTQEGHCFLQTSGVRLDSCVVRIPVPFAWFNISDSPSLDNNTAAVQKLMSVSHTISENCDAAFHDRPQTSITLTNNHVDTQKTLLATYPFLNISLLARSNATFTENAFRVLYIHLNATPNLTHPFEIRLWIDSRLTVERVFPISSDWVVKVTSAHRPQFYTSLFCTHSGNLTENWDGRILAILVKMKRNPGEVIRDDVVLHWHVGIIRSDVEKIVTGSSQLQQKVATKFAVVGDETTAVLLVPKRTELINTAIVSGSQVASTMRVFSVSSGGEARDVTSDSHCISANANVIKTSPTCTTVYVDGSEQVGAAGVQVYVHYTRFTASTRFVFGTRSCLLRLIWTNSPVSFPIKNWKRAVLKDLSSGKRTGAAKQFGCSRRYQQFQVKILASISAIDDATGEEVFLADNRRKFFDFTSFAEHSLHISNTSVASLRFHNGRALVQGENTGVARLLVKQASTAKELASDGFFVSAEMVSVAGLSAKPVCAIRTMMGRASPYKNSILSFNVVSQSAVTKLYQHCTLDTRISFSDGTWESIDDVDFGDYSIEVQLGESPSFAISTPDKHLVDFLSINEISTRTVAEVSLHSSSDCSLRAMTPLATKQVFLEAIGRIVPLQQDIPTTTVESTKDKEQLPMIPLPYFIAVILLLVFLFFIAPSIRRSRAFKGYEQLVAPIISRLSTSSSAGRAEDTNEWVWLSRAENTRSTIGSEYSQKSMRYKTDSSCSYDDNTKRSVSYRGSEISVFIAPSSANVSVNREPRQALADSTSDHNLTRMVSRDDTWHDHHHTLTWKKRQRNFGVMRESVA